MSALDAATAVGNDALLRRPFQPRQGSIHGARVYPIGPSVDDPYRDDDTDISELREYRAALLRVFGPGRIVGARHAVTLLTKLHDLDVPAAAIPVHGR